MTTVSALQSDLQVILSRDLSAEFATHYRLANAMINRDVRARAMVRVNAFQPGAEGVTTDKITGINLSDVFGASNTILAVSSVAYGLLSKPKHLELVSYEQLLEDADESPLTGTPRRFALSYNSSGALILNLTPAVDATDTEYLTVSAFVALTLDTGLPTSTNWLLTNHYDVYLYALATAACDTIQDFERRAKFYAQYKAAVAEVAKAENAARTGGSVIIRQGEVNGGLIH